MSRRLQVSGQCSKCACEKLYVVGEVSQPAHDSINVIVPLNVATLDVCARDVGLDDSNRYRAAIGRFEAWNCSSCGFTEWYAKGIANAFETAMQLAVPVGVRIAQRPPRAPYR